jgi:hypothetical protein
MWRTFIPLIPEPLRDHRNKLCGVENLSQKSYDHYESILIKDLNVELLNFSRVEDAVCLFFPADSDVI